MVSPRIDSLHALPFFFVPPLYVILSLTYLKWHFPLTPLPPIFRLKNSNDADADNYDLKIRKGI